MWQLTVAPCRCVLWGVYPWFLSASLVREEVWLILHEVDDPRHNFCAAAHTLQGSAAETAGIRQGDELVALDGQPVVRYTPYQVPQSTFPAVKTSSRCLWQATQKTVQLRLQMCCLSLRTKVQNTKCDVQNPHEQSPVATSFAASSAPGVSHAGRRTKLGRHHAASAADGGGAGL